MKGEPPLPHNQTIFDDTAPIVKVFEALSCDALMEWCLLLGANQNHNMP